MTATAIMFPIMRGMTPACLEFAEEALGPRLHEHDESRRRLGLTVERAWVEATNQGDVLIFYFESDDLERSLKLLGESDELYDIWFREKVFTLTGADFCDCRTLASSELVFKSPELKSEGPASAAATAFPILEGKQDEWFALLEELAGPREDEYRGYLWRYGLTVETFFVEHTPRGDMVIRYAEGDDPVAAIARFARSSHPFDVWLREEMLYLNGIDFIRRETAPPPHSILEWKAAARPLAA